MSKKEKYKRYGWEDAYDTEIENDWTNRLNLNDCIEIMNNQYNKIEELKQQLAEKDKMIRFYEGQLLPEHKVSLTKEFANFDRKQQARIRELEIRCQQQEQEIKILAKNQIQNLNHDIEIRHQVCDEIKEKIEKLKYFEDDWYVVSMDNVVEILNQVKKEAEGE